MHYRGYKERIRRARRRGYAMLAGAFLLGFPLFGKAALQYAAVPFSPRVQESGLERFVDDIAEKHDFHEPIEIEVIPNWTAHGPANADYDEERGTYILRVTRPFMRETVLRHEARHIIEGHVHVDRQDIFQRQLYEWDATFYGIGLTD